MKSKKPRMHMKTHHDVHLFLDLREHGLARHRDPLEDMMCRVIDRRRRSDKVDVREPPCGDIVPLSTRGGSQCAYSPWLK